MAEIIEIISSVNVIEVAPGGSAIEILEINTQGPPGPPGPFGTAASFTHTQSAAAAEWTVNHNLGAYPLAEIRSVGGIVVEAEILHVSVNQFKVFFDTAYSGFVRCI
ncbi:MAG TPA: hypothetical protein VNI84_04035 [Pyrinomonadaceae bacterium]|nr:hypothetical protein [Pyrinomonadaceae bacterium]